MINSLVHHSINAGYNDASHQNYLQAFNPIGGKDEIFGAVTTLIKVETKSTSLL